MARDQFEAIKDLMKRADEAILSGDLLRASEYLKDARPILANYVVESKSFSGGITMQATLMSLLAGDEDLARTFATMEISEVAGLLELYFGLYSSKQKEGDMKGAMDLLKFANIYATAFNPYVQSHPYAQMLQSNEALSSQGELAFAAQLFCSVRPKLDLAGWAHWSYPSEEDRNVKYWSARVMSDLGGAILDGYHTGYDVQLARSLAETSRELVEGLKPDQLTADIYNLLGRIFLAYSDHDLLKETAIPCFEKAIDILDSIGNLNDAASDRCNLGSVYMKLAVFDEVNGNTEEANKYSNKGEELLQHAIETYRTSGNVSRRIDALSNLGGLYASSKNWNRALEALSEAQSVAAGANLERSSGGVRTLINLGSVLCELGISERAEWSLRRAIEIQEELKAQNVVVEAESYFIAYGTLGKIFRTQERWSEAYALLTKALEQLEAYRSSFTSERTTFALTKRFRWLYEATVDCCFHLGVDHPEMRSQAFKLAESIKWLTLTTMLRYEYLRLPGKEEDPLLREEERILRHISDATIGSQAQSYDDINIVSSLKRLEEIWTELEPLYPDYVAIRRQKTIEAGDAAKLLDADVPMLIEYYLGDELGVALAFILRSDEEHPQMVRLEGSLKVINELVRELRSPDSLKSQERFKEISNSLYHIIIAPLQSLMPEGAGICIVPYGPLHNIPFSALYDGRKYLVERNPVVISPSATALRWWMKKNRRVTESSLIFTATSHIHTADGTMDDLKIFEGLALKQIAPQFSKSKVIIPEEATKQRLLEELNLGRNFWDVVHIACHGVSVDDGLNSRLLMPGDKTDRSKDLTALEIFTKVRTNASLVTLSACESGVALTSTGDEIAGLAQAFLFGGASSVLASLWTVRQDVGVAITGRFYELLKGDAKRRQSKIKALQAAQQEAFQKKEWFGFVSPWNHPYLWAAFQLYGDWR
jgi:CHAT domain-containing protein